MTHSLRIGIIGDYAPDHFSHIATINALDHAARALSLEIDAKWLPTASLSLENVEEKLAPFGGLWCAPKSPYVSTEVALRAICFARERQYPFIGT
jgi:CTP synthase (UTP-ammonia lyase)